MDIQESFRAAALEAGVLLPARIVADGKLHRCDAEGKGGKGDAAYILFMDGVPSGGFQNWRTGEEWRTWCSKRREEMTPEEIEANRKIIEAASAQREADDKARKAAAREAAFRIHEAGKPAPESHAYLARKKIKPCGVLVSDKGNLIIPMRDASGVLHSIQSIGPDGEKRFLPGGRVAGCYFSIGKPDRSIIICEGFATGATLHEATGAAVAVAFNCGNLVEVAKIMRAKFPATEIIIGADDDFMTLGNPGMVKAKAAADAVKGRVCAPAFNGQRQPKETDWNDLAARAGLAEVKRQIMPDPVKLPWVTLADASDGHLARCEMLIKSGGVVGPRSGIAGLDGFIRGFEAGRLYIVAARPAMGKSAFMSSIAFNMAEAGHKVAVFNLEMTAQQTAARMMARLTGFATSRHAEAGDFFRYAVDARRKLAGLPMRIVDRGGMTIEVVNAILGEMIAGGFKPDVVFIDHISMMAASDPKANRVHQVGHITRTAKAMAMAHGLPMVCLCQLSRGVERRENTMPMLADLRDSGEIEQDADVVMFLHREGYYVNAKADKDAPRHPDDTATLGIAKNRDGETGTKCLKWSGVHQWFSDVDNVNGMA